jgi:hypothetical protein
MIAALAIAAAMLNPQVTPDTLGLTICRPGYTKVIRPPNSYITMIKTRLLPAGADREAYVVDHSIALEIGGAPRWPNLRVQTIAEAKRKDVLEHALHRAVCSGAISLPAAQAEMARRWP